MLHPQAEAEKLAPLADRVGPLVEGAVPVKLPFTIGPEALVRVRAAVDVLGGALLAAGRARRPAALLLAGAQLPGLAADLAALARRSEHPERRRERLDQAVTGLGLLGGLLLAAVDTEGRPGLRWRADKAADHLADRISDRTSRLGRDARHLGRDAKHLGRDVGHEVGRRVGGAGRFLRATGARALPGALR